VFIAIGYIVYALLVLALADLTGWADVHWPWKEETKINHWDIEQARLELKRIQQKAEEARQRREKEERLLVKLKEEQERIKANSRMAIPSAPSNINVALVSDGTGIYVGWRDNSDNETGYDISNGVKRLQVGPNQTSLSSDLSNWGGLSPGQRMCFRVSSYNDVGSSAPTAWDCITMPKKENLTTKKPPKSPQTKPSPQPVEAAERRRQEEHRLASSIDTEIQDNYNRAKIQQLLEDEHTGIPRQWKNTFTNNTVLVRITRTYDSGTTPCRQFKVLLVGKYTQVERVKRACREGNGVWRWR
jgi:hypothetical protein